MGLESFFIGVKPPEPKMTDAIYSEFSTEKHVLTKSDNLYEGTKRLYAWPMTKAAYCDYRGWEVPSDEDAAELGYLVEYLDGGKVNHADHTGYISWTPANVFEATYYNVSNANSIDFPVPTPEQMKDNDLRNKRAQALNAAIRIAEQGDSPDTVIQMAKQCYNYVEGE